MSDRVVAAVVGSTIEAQLVVGLLEANGIPAVLSADDAGGQDPALDVTDGVRIFVDSSDLEVAQAIIENPTD